MSSTILSDLYLDLTITLCSGDYHYMHFRDMEHKVHCGYFLKVSKQHSKSQSHSVNQVLKFQHSRCFKILSIYFEREREQQRGRGRESMLSAQDSTWGLIP